MKYTLGVIGIIACVVCFFSFTSSAEVETKSEKYRIEYMDCEGTIQRTFESDGKIKFGDNTTSFVNQKTGKKTVMSDNFIAVEL